MLILNKLENITRTGELSVPFTRWAHVLAFPLFLPLKHLVHRREEMKSLFGNLSPCCSAANEFYTFSQSGGGWLSFSPLHYLHSPPRCFSFFREVCFSSRMAGLQEVLGQLESSCDTGFHWWHTPLVKNEFGPVLGTLSMLKTQRKKLPWTVTAMDPELG